MLVMTDDVQSFILSEIIAFNASWAHAQTFHSGEEDDDEIITIIMKCLCY